MAFHQRGILRCWLHGAARLPSANVTPSLWDNRLSCKHGQTWQQRTAAAAKYPFLFFNTSSPLLLFTHTSFSLITIFYLALSSCRISSHLILPLFLYRSLSPHLSRRCSVDNLLQPRPCIPVFFHTSTSSVTLQHLESTQNTNPLSGPRATLVDLRPFRPAFQQRHYVS